MGSMKALLIAGGVALAATSVAKAADLPQAPAFEPAAPAPVEFSGWYLRGDVGMGVNVNKSNIVDSPNPLAGEPADAAISFSNPTVSGSGIIDIGVGYQFNNWFRADITAEHRDFGHFQTLIAVNEPAELTQFGAFFRGNTSSNLLMANGYVDLGTWWCMTPFLGAGVGWAQNRTYGVTDEGFAGSPAGGDAADGGFFDNGSTNNFAWSLMAGVDFNVTQNLKLELSYRYLDYGIAKTGPSHCLNGNGTNGGFSPAGTPGCGDILSTGRLAASDLRLGLRWLISDVPYTPGPIVTKY